MAYSQEDKSRGGNPAAYGCGDYYDWLRHESVVWSRLQVKERKGEVAPLPTLTEDEVVASHDFDHHAYPCVCRRCGVSPLFASWNTCERRQELVKLEEIEQQLRKRVVHDWSGFGDGWIDRIDGTHRRREG